MFHIYLNILWQEWGPVSHFHKTKRKEIEKTQVERGFVLKGEEKVG